VSPREVKFRFSPKLFIGSTTEEQARFPFSGVEWALPVQGSAISFSKTQLTLSQLQPRIIPIRHTFTLTTFTIMRISTYFPDDPIGALIPICLTGANPKYLHSTHGAANVLGITPQGTRPPGVLIYTGPSKPQPRQQSGTSHQVSRAWYSSCPKPTLLPAIAISLPLRFVTRDIRVSHSTPHISLHLRTLQRRCKKFVSPCTRRARPSCAWR